MKKNPHAFVAIADHTVGFAGTAVPAVGFRGPLRKSVEKRENKTELLAKVLGAAGICEDAAVMILAT
jgi:hypothetical protein